MQKKAVVLLAFLFISSFPAIAPSFSTASARVYVDPPAVIDPGAFFNVSVKVDNLADLAGVDWSLTWNPTLLRAVNVTEIMFHEITPPSEWDNIWCLRNRIDLDRVWYAYLWASWDRAVAGGYAPISGNHTMAIVTFEVLGMGCCKLQFLRWRMQLLRVDSAGAPQPIEYEVTDGFFSNSVPPLSPSPVEPPKLLIYMDPRRVMNESLAVNERFTVDVRMDSLTNHSGIIRSDFIIWWDPTLLECVGLAYNQSWQYREWPQIYNDLGECGLMPSAGSNPPEEAVFGNLTLATVTFAVKRLGSCSLHLQLFWLEEASAPGVQLSYAPVDGYFANTLSGDLNGEGTVDVFDAMVLAKAFGAHLNGFGWNEAADINGDMWVDLFDAILLGSLFGHTS